MDKPRTLNIYFGALVLGGIAIGFAPIFVRLSQAEIGPVASGFWRLAIAFPAFMLWNRLEGPVKKEPHRTPTKKDKSRFILMLAGVAFAVDLIAWHWSIKLTSVANATLLGNCSVIILALIEWLWFRIKLKFTFLIGMVLALVGVSLIAGVSISLGGEHVLGDGLGLLTAFFYAAYLLLIKQFRKTFRTSTIMSWASITCAVFLLPVAFFSNEVIVPTSIYGWGAVIGLALISHVFGQGLIATALAHLPASFSGVVLLIQPVVAAILGYFILGESLSPTQFLGGLIVLTGIFLARKGSG